MLRNMVTSLLQHEKIQTTDARARELRKLAERMITLGKKGLRSSHPEGVSDQDYAASQLHLFRQSLKVLRDKDVARKVFNELAERYEERAGGYTRILKCGPRPGDNAPVSIIELVDRNEDE